MEQQAAQDWQLAQINVGTLVALNGDPRVAPFFAALDRINAIADQAPGFVWRLQTEAGDATAIEAGPEPRLILNMSVWASAALLFDFVYRSAHKEILAQRAAFFEKPASAFQALWWVPAGHRPSVDEGLARLWQLDRFGPSRFAFTFKEQYPPPELASRALVHAVADHD